MSIKTTIKIDWMPDYFPDQEYVERYYLKDEEVRLASANNIILTSDAWEDIRFTDYNQQKIQSSTQEKYQIKFVTTESVNVDLLERAGRVLITPDDGDSYYAYNVELTDDYEPQIRTFVYTMTYTKDNILNYATYLASNDVKDYFDLSSENIVNRIDLLVRNTVYVGRSAITNSTHATYGKYNIKFSINNDYDHISVDDKFYCHYNDLEQQIDYRTRCVGKDSNYIYFGLESHIIGTVEAIEYPALEITLNNIVKLGIASERWTEEEVLNLFQDSIYTFLYSKGDEETNLGSTTEQIQGIQQYQQQKYKDIRTILVYLRPDELYKINKLQMCKPEDITLVEYSRTGIVTNYYPVTMEGLVTKNERAELKGLLEYQITIKYNNLVVNVNR